MSQKIKILLVEDEDLVALMTEDLLSFLGHQVMEIAWTLQGGMEAARRGAFDLALLDINLRGEQSYAIADVLTDSSIPFLFVTGYGHQILDNRFNHIIILQKPFTPEALQQKILDALAASAM